MIRAVIDRQRMLQRASRGAVSEARRLWRGVDRGAIAASWSSAVPRLVAVIAGAQLLAGQTADDYIAAALSAQDMKNLPGAQINPYGLVGVASDGRPLESLLLHPAFTTLAALSTGATIARAMQTGYAALESMTRTQVSDAFRVSDSIAGTSRKVTTYVRVLTPPSCSRCVVLAGDDRAWNTAFQRHPGCDCVSLPTTRTRGMRQKTDPRAYFDSLSPAEQDRYFTKAGAQAIRDGADIGKVVNARRKAAGMSGTVSKRDERKARSAGIETIQRDGRGRLQTLDVFGDQRFVTFEGDFVGLPGGGSAPRLMPESIYQIAESQEQAIRLLQRHGYIVDRPRFAPSSDGRLVRVG